MLRRSMQEKASSVADDHSLSKPLRGEPSVQSPLRKKRASEIGEDCGPRS